MFISVPAKSLCEVPVVHRLYLREPKNRIQPPDFTKGQFIQESTPVSLQLYTQFLLPASMLINHTLQVAHPFLLASPALMIHGILWSCCTQDTQSLSPFAFGE